MGFEERDPGARFPHHVIVASLRKSYRSSRATSAKSDSCLANLIAVMKKLGRSDNYALARARRARERRGKRIAEEEEKKPAPFAPRAGRLAG